MLNHKTYQTFKKEVNRSARTIVHYISTASADEFGEVLLPAGMDDSRFKAVLWCHSLGLGMLDERVPPPSELVIGKSLWRKAEADGVIACTEFANTPLGNDVMRFNAEGYINSWSVGWKPKGAKKIDSKTGITVYPKWYLYEYSSVIIPANPDAINLMLKDAKSGGMKKILAREREMTSLKNELKDALSEISKYKEELKEKLKNEPVILRRGEGSHHLKSRLIQESLGKVMEEILGRKL